MYYQRTLAASVECKGIGLHSGRVIRMRIHPAPEDHGIVFFRTDTSEHISIPARLDYVIDTTLATTLGKDGVVVSTVEHFLSACFGMGVDNALVELDGPEVPIMDGSAAPFVYLIRSTGIRRLSAPRRFLVIRRPYRVVEGEKGVAVFPSKELKISFAINFSHPMIQDQSLEFTFSDRAYDLEISRARTFGFLNEVKEMQNQGYALGGSLENALVLDEYRVLNEEGLRYPDEFVRHKILDSLGDLSLIGLRVLGHFRAWRSGHTLNHRLIQRVLADPSGWRVVSLPHGEGIPEPSYEWHPGSTAGPVPKPA